MKLTSFLSIIFLISLSSCSNSGSDTIIAKNQLGPLNPDTQLKDLSSLLANDSIADFDLETKFNRAQEVEVFNQASETSLIIEPFYQNDSLATIKEIQILDPRYETRKGLSIASDFKTIYENYKIDNIQNSINSVILSIDEIGAYIVIDKKHLPSELKFDAEIQIEANQIPDDAPLKYFWLKFEG